MSTSPDERVRLERQAAVELQGELLSYHGTVGPPHYSRKRDADLSRPFAAFVEAARAFRSDEEVAAAARAARTNVSDVDLEREVRRWVTGMRSAERSATRIAIGPAQALLRTSWDRHGAELCRHYALVSDERSCVLVLPGHVLAWGRDRKVKHRDLGKRSAHDSDAVLETLLGLYDPTGQGALRQPKAALRAARALVNQDPVRTPS